MKFTLAAIVIYLVFYLIPLLLLSLFEMRTSFGRQAHLRLGVALLALGTASFGVGLALARRYPDAYERSRSFHIAFDVFCCASDTLGDFLYVGALSPQARDSRLFCSVRANLADHQLNDGIVRFSLTVPLQAGIPHFNSSGSSPLGQGEYTSAPRRWSK